MTPRFDQKTTTAVYDRVIRACLLLTIGLVPIFFLPLTTDPLETNKIALLAVLMCVAGGAWLLRSILARAPMKKVPIAVPILAFLVCAGVATIFSWFRYRSLVGESGGYAQSLISTVLFLAFFFFLTQTFTKRDLPNVLGAFLLSGTIIALLNFFQVFGWYVFPWSFTQVVSFSALANSPLTLCFFLALLGLFAFMKFLRLQSMEQKTHGDRMKRTLLVPLMILCLFLLSVYDNPIGWYTVIVGLVLLLIVVNAAMKTAPPVYFILPALVLGVALLGLFVNTQPLFQANIPSDVQLPVRYGSQITWEAVKDRPLFGFGQGTYAAVFSAYRPIEYNDTAFSSVRFVKSSNEWFQSVASIGVLGTLAFAVVLFFALLRQWRSFRTVQPGDAWWWYHAGVFIGSVLLVALLFFTVWNVVLAIMLWLFLGAGVVLEDLRPQAVRPGQGGSPGSPVLSLIFALFVIVVVVFAYYGGRWYAADVQSGKANEILAAQESLDDIRSHIARAISLNPYEQRYAFDLAQNLLVQAQLAAQAENPDVNQIRTFLTAAFASAASGREKYPAFSGTHEAFATTGAGIDALTQTLSPETETAFLTALEKEPTNPGLAMSLGQYYLTYGQTLQGDEKKEERDGMYAKALAQYVSAQKLQTNPVNATLNAALVLRLQEKGTEAIAMVEDLAAKNPSNIDVLFNLAEQYRLDEKGADAKSTYQSIVNLFPGHSDAHFRLGEIAEKAGDTATARAEYEAVLQLNPGNTSVKEKLDSLP